MRSAGILREASESVTYDEHGDAGTGDGGADKQSGQGPAA
jgi:hypothetical protein